MNKGGPTKAAYDKAYNARPEQVDKREMRNKARAEMARDGKVKKGDGKDVDHKKALSKGGKTVRSNLRVEPASANRSYARKSDHSIK